MGVGGLVSVVKGAGGVEFRVQTECRMCERCVLRVRGKFDCITHSLFNGVPTESHMRNICSLPNTIWTQ